MFLSGAEKLLKNSVERIEVLEDLKAAGCFVLPVIDWEGFSLLEIEHEVWFSNDIDTEVVGVREEFAEWCFVTSDI